MKNFKTRFVLLVVAVLSSLTAFSASSTLVVYYNDYQTGELQTFNSKKPTNKTMQIAFSGQTTISLMADYIGEGTSLPTLTSTNPQVIVVPESAGGGSTVGGEGMTTGGEGETAGGTGTTSKEYTLVVLGVGSTELAFTEGEVELMRINVEVKMQKISYDTRTGYPNFSIEYGQSFSNPIYLYTPNVKLAYTSSNPNVAMVDTVGNVTINGVGETKVTAVFTGNDTYEAATLEYTLKVNKMAASTDALSFMYVQNDTLNLVLGSSWVANGAQVLRNRYNLPLTCTSSNPQVATLDTNGVVTVIKEGETKLTAAFEGDDFREAMSASCVLVVTKTQVTLQYQNEQYSAVYGETFTAPSPVSNIIGLTCIYTSSNPQVAVVDTLGNVTIVGAGETKITAFAEEDAEYSSASASYTLVVAKQATRLSFFTDYYSMESGTTFEGLQLNNPNELPVKWTSSVVNVATVDENGKVTAVSPGTTIIKAVFEGDANREGSSAEYQLEVMAKSLGLAVCSREVTEANASDILGDGKVSYDPETKTVTLKGVSKFFTEKDYCYKGSIVQSYGLGKITVRVEGINVFQNCYLGFSGETFNFVGEEGASVTASGMMSQVEADSVMVNGISLDLTSEEGYGTAALMANALLQVKNGAHVLAKTTATGTTQSNSGAAILTGNFVAGNGIHIMTEGVIFQKETAAAGGYFADVTGASAKEVEIGGKVEAVETETTVTFVSEGTATVTPGESTTKENVTISLGANDTVDEQDGSLVVTSTVSTETLETLLETKLPGTSDFDNTYKGLYMLLSAGQGTYSVDFATMGDYQLTIMEGDNKVGDFTKATKGELSFNYNVTEDTWVFVFATDASGLRSGGDKGLKIYNLKVSPQLKLSEVEETTAEDTDEKVIYDLQGRKVKNPGKGMYVINGKVTLLK